MTLEDAIRAIVRDELAAIARPPEPDRLLDIQDAAAVLGIGRTAAYGEIQAGRLRSLKVGRRRLVSSTALAAYIEAAQSEYGTADHRPSVPTVPPSQGGRTRGDGGAQVPTGDLGAGIP
ncbi:MAG TPA: helix-turn-helix domain-containing protein [Candidatus Limnocylindrales bacterium]|nr:helix-turn-helix domain-containing protein [Candidatus Limnocylindrales bacterium]